MNLYDYKPNVIIGFHGCDNYVAENILLSSKPKFCPSVNDYDWLGSGMYFWENDYHRALSYAKVCVKRKNSTINNPAVIGAVIELGNCLDLTNYKYTELLSAVYSNFHEFCQNNNIDVPKNNTYFRQLDCAVINFLHAYFPQYKFDSVRGLFVEGEKLYDGAEFYNQTHSQIAIINPNMIKGYFRPIEHHDMSNIKKYPITLIQDKKL